MTSASRESVSSQIERLFREGTLTSLSDAQLLDRYLTARDEAAFEALVNLHGPMVLGLCRRMLRDPRDIEDAFQATFLVLVRKAPRIRDRGLLANWLYGVAYRVAVRARGNVLRRREREKSLGEIDPPARPELDVAEEIPPALDQELNRLPARYRFPLVLCYLKGLTHDQAAEALGCPVGTVRSRLARGRNLLKRRLTARGQAPSAVALSAPLPSPAVPVPLVRATVAAAGKLISSKGVLAAAVITAAEKLAEGVFPTMISSRLKTILLSLLALGLTTSGVVGIMAVSGRRQRAKSPAKQAVTQLNKPDAEKTALPLPKKVKPGDFILVEVLEALPGRPISGMRLVRPDGTISLGFYGDVQVAGLDRYEIKAKVVNHLRQYLSDVGLGLFVPEEGADGLGRPAFDADPNAKGVFKRVRPVDTDRVFVDESVDQYNFPGSSDERWQKTEEKLDRVLARLDSLAQGKGAEQAKGHEPGTSTLPSSVQSDAADPRKSDLWKAYQNMRGGYPALGTPPWEAPQFDLPRAISEDLLRLSALLTTAERLFTEREKRAALGKATQDEVAKTRSTFETAKGMIPEAIRQAREHLEEVKLSSAELKAEWNAPTFQASLSAARIRFEEAKKQKDLGKISEEDYLNAEGDYLTISNWLNEPQTPTKEQKRFDTIQAELSLRFAEDLRDKYLPDPRNRPDKEVNPK